MRRMYSIRARLSLVFLFLFVLIIVLGLSSLASLSSFDSVAVQIPDRWLPSAHIVGDLNNYTSDFRAAEASLLLATSQSELESSERDMRQLDRNIATAQNAYVRIRHDSAETELYGRFVAKWNAYRSLVRQIQMRLAQHDRAGAVRLYATTSKAAYDAASDTLGLITDSSVASAREASQRSERAYWRACQRIVVAILLAGLLFVGATAYVTNAISAPLLDLAGRMHRLAASETSVQVLGTQRPDEIGEMARAVVVFRNNAVDLAASRRALALQASMLEEKLTEEQRLTRLQRNFVSMASHEFRTPLAIIDGHAQRLTSMRDRLTPDELVERMRKIRNAVRRMTQLIDNLIGSARLIDGGVELYYHPVELDLTALLHEVCHMQRELTANAQILELLAPQPLALIGDANLLFQVFGNLLSNAVKYSPQGGLIKVSATRGERVVTVTVEDRGIGICERDRVRLFERYFRGSNASGIGGTGVGLYLVKMVVELHRGTVSVHSREGEGSRFMVQLPIHPAETQVRRLEKECA